MSSHIVRCYPGLSRTAHGVHSSAILQPGGCRKRTRSLTEHRCNCVHSLLPVPSVPFEVRVVGDKEPVYDFSLEDLGRVNETVVLPFNAYGTLAWARNEFENNSASSQV